MIAVSHRNACVSWASLTPSRRSTWFPVYGVNPNGYGNDGNMNCDLTLSSSLSLALSLGAHITPGRPSHSDAAA